MPPVGGFDAGLFGGGAGLGNAHASITMDISSLQDAERQSRSIGRNIEQNLNGIGQGAANVETGFSRASQEIRAFGGAFQQSLSSANNLLRSFRTELLAIGAGAGLTLGFGLKAAQDIRAARIRLSQFVETEQEANELMNMLADSAGDFGLEIGGVLSLAGTLLPLLEGNVEATAEWVKRAARLRSVLPTAQQGAEIRAITNYLSGSTTSLQKLFDIPPSIIQEAKDKFQDVGDQVDYILDRMGATEEATRAMAEPLVAIKNELKLIASVGFTPILENLREILPGIREFLENLRKTRPEILQLGADFVTAVAVAAPMLLFLNTVLSTLQKIHALGALGILGKAGAVGLAAVGGGVAVTEGLRFIGRATEGTAAGDFLGSERLQNITFMEAVATSLKAVADMFFSFSHVMFPIFRAVEDAFLGFAETVATIQAGLGKLYSQIGNILPDELGGDRFRAAGAGIQSGAAETLAFIESIKKGRLSLDEFAERVAIDREKVADFIERLTGTVKPDVEGGSKVGAAGVPTAGIQTLTELQQAQIESWQQYQEAITAVESRMQERRLQITEQYEEQRTRIIERYEQTIAREAEDFGRQRARAEANLQEDITDIRADAAEREAEWWQDLGETIGELRTDSADRIAQIEEEANRDRERMEREHRLNLLQAASRLDAAGVANEQMRFRNQVTNFEQDLQVRLERERENLRERIEQEQEAHQERLEEARKADAERIEDLKKSHAERVAIEDEDRAIRLRRMKEDHIQQLTELKKSHFDRLNELKRQAGQELANLKAEFIKRALELTNFYNQWLTTQVDEQTESLRQWQEFWKEWYTIQQEAVPTTGGGGRGTSSVPPIQGPAMFGAGAMWGTGNNGGAAYQTTTTNGGSVNANIVINASPGQSVMDIGDVVQRKVIELIRSVS